MSSLTEVKLHAFCAFYLLANFILFFIPFWLYGAYHGSLVCRALLVLTAIDYLVPLKLGKGGLWVWWCKVTGIADALRSYFNAEVVVEGEWSKERNYLLVYHPHSLFGIGYMLIVEYFYETYGTMFLFTGADVIRFLPLLRRIMSWWGFTSVSASAMKHNLRQAYPYHALQLQVGGIAEMFYGLDHEQILLRKRMGFCKLALQTGCCLVPCYVFGANEMYTRIAGPRSLLARVSSRMQTSLVVWSGRWGLPFGMVCHRAKMVVAVGAPIDVGRVEQPSSAEIEALHARYCEALRGLFERHKGRMGSEWVARRGSRLYLEDEATPGSGDAKKTE